MTEKQWNDVNREVSNWMTADEVIDSYVMTLVIDGCEVTLRGEEAINMLQLFANYRLLPRCPKCLDKGKVYFGDADGNEHSLPCDCR